jgi:hypothetical protein
VQQKVCLMSDDWRKVADDWRKVADNCPDYYRVSLGFQHSQTKAQIEAAEYAKQSVRWMKWSVVVLAAASVLSFILDLLTFLR